MIAVILPIREASYMEPSDGRPFHFGRIRVEKYCSPDITQSPDMSHFPPSFLPPGTENDHVLVKSRRGSRPSQCGATAERRTVSKGPVFETHWSQLIFPLGKKINRQYGGPARWECSLAPALYYHCSPTDLKKNWSPLNWFEDGSTFFPCAYGNGSRGQKRACAKNHSRPLRSELCTRLPRPASTERRVIWEKVRLVKHNNIMQQRQ